tara:strand:- start:196 stop:501 length:306 start_codon:yes stop_codon:yes gene_type:complete
MLRLPTRGPILQQLLLKDRHVLPLSKVTSVKIAGRVGILRLKILPTVNIRMILNYTDFTDDEEKMKDFFYLSKERFLESYSYLTEEEYNLTLKKVNDLASS